MTDDVILYYAKEAMFWIKVVGVGIVFGAVFGFGNEVVKLILKMTKTAYKKSKK